MKKRNVLLLTLFMASMIMCSTEPTGIKPVYFNDVMMSPGVS